MQHQEIVQDNFFKELCLQNFQSVFNITAFPVKLFYEVLNIKDQNFYCPQNKILESIFLESGIKPDILLFKFLGFLYFSHWYQESIDFFSGIICPNPLTGVGEIGYENLCAEILTACLNTTVRFPDSFIILPHFSLW